MIKVSVKLKDNKINQVVIKGHANFDVVGKDIVCSAVSSMTITTINAIISLSPDAITYKESEGYVEINVTDNETANILLNNFINLLDDLAKNYPKNINIRKDE